eukprot:maker-scaffold_12-snap-gene-0.55-mRNA-1 protein AED:0.19 eAED:0.19 QI:0/0/0/1/1/1/2/0/151
MNPYKILSKEEIEKCRDTFIQFDEDESGTIDMWELEKVFKSMGQDLSEEELMTFISQVDNDNSNSIDFGEFLIMMAKQKLEKDEGRFEQDLKDAWAAVGGNKDLTGHLDTQKLVQILNVDFGLSIDVNSLVRKVDASGDGQVFVFLGMTLG